MASEGIPQDQLLEDSRSQLEKVNAEARRLAGDMTEAQLRWAPPDGGWSVAQVFAHLASATGSYLPALRSAIAADRATGAPRKHESWHPSFFGRLLIRSLEPSSRRSMPSPKIWRPTNNSPPAALEAFLETQKAVAAAIHEARDIDLVRARLSSPVSRLIRLNVGDALRVFVVHDWRHLGQVERIIGREGFPSA